MNFVEAVKSYFIKWLDFRSRSSRSEYWWATLFIAIAPAILGYVIGFIIGFIFALAGFSESFVLSSTMGVTIIINVFILVASTALVIRRLHDVDRTGWWYLIVFTIIGIIPLLIWFCTKGTQGMNRFGQDPLNE